MSRELAVFGLLLLGLGWATQACGGPVADVAPNSPEAQATNVRRTAVAAVQAIIANHPTATPLPPATATPSPTCQNAIWWTEARSHVGESRTIQGTVVATRPAPGGLAMLEIGQPYPDPTGLFALVPSTSAARFSGKTLCLPGRINMAEGRPTVQVRDPSVIVVLD
jgi:hypothetical protein